MNTAKRVNKKPPAPRRGGPGTAEPNEINRGGSGWSTVTREERNAFLLEMARAGASLRALRDLVRPPLSIVGISKVLAAGGHQPRPRGGTAEPIGFLRTGIGPIDELRRVASSIPGLTVGELVTMTELSDWTIRELLVLPVNANAVARGTLRHADALDRIAQVREAKITLTRPRAAGPSLLSRLSLAVFGSYSDSYTWTRLASETQVPTRILQRLVGERADGKGFDPLDRIAAALGYGWELAHYCRGNPPAASAGGKP